MDIPTSTQQTTFENEVIRLLSAEENLCKTLIEFIRSKIEDSFSITRLTSLFGEKEEKFSSKQARNWLITAFKEKELPWDENHVPYVIQHLLESKLIDLNNHDPDFS